MPGEPPMTGRHPVTGQHPITGQHPMSGEYPMPPQVQRPAQPAPPPAPASIERAERRIDDSQELLQRTEIRSHRTAAGKGGGWAGRDDDKATESELNRLLGFFDEIRKARAWDEEPAGSRPNAW
jgi:hypothetical protein